MKPVLPALVCVIFATAALGHGGVTNPAVMARMEAMSAIASEVKALSAMARGEVDFDAAEVAARMGAIVARGGEVPALFEAPETDPKSEASPAIWASYPEFTMRAAKMIAAAKAGAGAADALELEAALGALAQSCKSCHGSFKTEK